MQKDKGKKDKSEVRKKENTIKKEVHGVKGQERNKENRKVKMKREDKVEKK